MNFISKYKINIIVFFITLISIYLLFPEYLYKYLVPIMAKNNQLFLFGDWSVIISAVDCKNIGLNVFIENPCDFIGREHVYGSLLLFIPYIKEFSKVYFFYFPIFVNILFIVIVTLHFDFSKFKNLFLFIFFIFNPSTLLIMERFNIDLLILINVILISYFSSNYLRLLIVPLLTSIKFYPAILFNLFFLNTESSFKKSFLLLVISLMLAGIIIYWDIDNIIEILNNSHQFIAYDRYLFSLMSVPTYLNMESKFVLLLMFFIFFLYSYFIYYYLSNKITALTDQNNEKINYNTILMLAGSGILCATFFIFKNIYYREIFLFCALPYIIQQANKHNVFEYLIYFLIFRYIFFLLSNGLSLHLANHSLIFYKYILDFMCVGFLFAIIIFEYSYIYKIYKKKIYDKKFW